MKVRLHFLEPSTKWSHSLRNRFISREIVLLGRKLVLLHSRCGSDGEVKSHCRCRESSPGSVARSLVEESEARGSTLYVCQRILFGVTVRSSVALTCGLESCARLYSFLIHRPEFTGKISFLSSLL